MNNAFLEPEQTLDSLELLREEETKMVKIVEALQNVALSKEWKKLQDLLFSDVEKTLERQLRSEATKVPINEAELYRLQGQLIWCRKYMDLNDLVKFFHSKLEGIRNRLKTNG